MPFLRLCLLALFLALPGLSWAQDTGPSGTITAAQTAQQDAEIAVRLREILQELGNYEDVTVTVADGIVTFRGTATSLTEAQALDGLAARVEGVVAVKNEVRETSDIVRRLDPAWDRFMGRVDALLVQLPLALIALGVFLLIVFIGLRIGRMRRPWDRLAPNAFIADLFRTLVKIAFVIIGIVIALDIMNATALLSTILGAAGLIGLAIGFAVRDTVENFIASVMLSIRQPFRPNDVVEINGDEGKVIRLTSRATILLSFDGNHIRIPNATVFKSRIVNYSQNPERRFMFTVGVESGADLGAVREAATEAVRALPFVVETPGVSVWLGEITDSGVEVIVTGWIDQRETSLLLARSEALRAVMAAIEAMGVKIPDTTYTIRMASEDTTPPPTPKTTLPVPDRTAVTTDAEAELDKIVEAEREDDENEDLLREDAAKE
ncbi:mechanosensitive ion channel family protein [Salibaculum griseiflavum]|uniref:Small-conductance mechanosensitive channel n=1 Tax=Salibaculum griseiflavum TaxID=1914409 RepID=A0A2V1P850_9RHOB|nr:mechanosensitive ion channel family protein [Salibaculum griseiflavum]PWG17547.1 mechanosensitive ion channel protein MscS [Salibaculum griseiflavum]